jgi:drug/metabolite transporter (DMT)-like permease
MNHPLLLTSVAMLCFAANSLLCRLALAPDLIDPATFTSVRVLSASLMLSMLVWLQRRHPPRLSFAKPRSVAALFAYLIFFSFAYTRLSAGTGALILFTTVQLTMFAVALREGERFSAASWGGLAVAVAGLVYLVLPGISAPDPFGAFLMAGSGIAWGFFSLLARGAENPIEANATNFLWCLPLASAINLFQAGSVHALPWGVALAVASGAVASGLGYAVWYLALRHLTAARAATVQLSVPAIAALGGVLLLSEPLSTRLLLASAATLGGISVVMTQRSARKAR